MDTAIYFSHLRELITLEQKEEQEAFRQSMEAKGATRFGTIICQPNCRYPIEVMRTSNNAMGQFTAEVRFDCREDESDIEFEPGRPVCFFSIRTNSVAAVHMQCYVERIWDDRLVVTLPSSAAVKQLVDLASTGRLGVQIGVDNTSYQVMLDALKEAEHSTSDRFVQLRDVLLGKRHPSSRPMPRLTYPWLNLSQQDAIQRVVESQDVAILHGPPGTGKTTTLVEAIIETLRRETQVLVCAASNAAVDWISEQLARRGVHVLRIGNPLRISNEMLDCSYERRYADHPDYHELWSARRELHQTSAPEQRSRIVKRISELQQRISNDILNQARVISCTLVGASYHHLEHRRFGTLFIDEAAQALEPACWAAILHADRVVMGGDHQQLPPTVKCREAVLGGLSNTLMQKVVSLWPQTVSLLDMQYRMNEKIMQFPSQWFYNGRLRAAPQVADMLISPIDSPLVWLDTSQLDSQEQASQGTSLTNVDEARLVISTLRDYIDFVSIQRVEEEHIDFAIITPYRAQARLIRRMLHTKRFYKRLRRQISVGTVDGFQGRERDVVLISLVRDNNDGKIGFLRDLRRMNVAMTRARMKLIIIGNATTLSAHSFYRQLISHIRKHGDFLQPTPPEEPQSPQPTPPEDLPSIQSTPPEEPQSSQPTPPEDLPLTQS